MNLILIKHSQPEIVETLPARGWHLSEEGKVRAERLANRLISYQPESLFSSVEPKAIETAHILGAGLDLKVSVFEDLHEHDRSTAPYLSKDQFENSVREFFLNPYLLVFGNETADQSHHRFSKAVHSILESNRNKTIAIVSHGTVISLFVSRLSGVSDFSLWKELGLPSFLVLDMNSNTLLAQENIL